MHSPHAHKPWAVIIAVIAALACGLYWYISRHDMAAPVAPITPIVQSDQQAIAPEAEIADIEASLQNTVIPEYSKAF